VGGFENCDPKHKTERTDGTSKPATVLFMDEDEKPMAGGDDRCNTLSQRKKKTIDDNRALEERNSEPDRCEGKKSSPTSRNLPPNKLEQASQAALGAGS
jgi:hypothetical protein